MARAREERSAAVRELEEVAEDAKVQREKVGKLEQERRASLELQSASEQLSKQRDSLQSEVEALRSELKAREEKNRELESGKDRLEAVIEGGQGLAIPILTSTLTTVSAFGPMLAIPGGSG